jgi:glycosyltransferase involved in cell wall biosynthesis
MRVTVSMPCFGRPKRTIRAIESLFSQNINGWEALVVGDGCPVIADFINSGTFEAAAEGALKNGNRFEMTNLDKNYGGCGYYITNMNIHRAVGAYFVFLDNDDVILPNHLDNYLSGIEGTNYDFVYYDSYVEPYGGARISNLSNGHIGHSELIIRTDYLRLMPAHTNVYGHDWSLVENMIVAGAKSQKAVNKPQTYIVKSVPVKKEEGFD